jgi:hypothetical protein
MNEKARNSWKSVVLIASLSAVPPFSLLVRAAKRVTTSRQRRKDREMDRKTDTPQSLATASRQKLELADEVLERHQNFRLSDRDRDVFLALIESEENPNTALKRAAEEYKTRFG